MSGDSQVEREADEATNRVMTDWPELPMTLSSRIEGWRLEMIYRRDDRVVARDILDRMPPRPDGGHCMVSSSLQQLLQAVLILLDCFGTWQQAWSLSRTKRPRLLATYGRHR